MLTLRNNNMKLKPYPEYRDSGIKWIGEIPEEWGVRKLKYICTKYAEYGLNISSDNYQTEGIRFIRTTDIDDYGNLQNRGIYLNKSLCKGYTLNCGDLLISRSGTIGRTFLFNSKKNGEATYAGYLVRFSINKNKAMPKYVFYFTKTNSFFGWLEIQSIETTIENVNGQKYANLLLTIPPLPDQIVIANFLDSKTSKIDALIEKDKKLIELLKEKRTALINHAVTKGLDLNAKLKDSGIDWIGEIPEGWEVRKVSKGFDIIGSGTTPKSQEEIYYDKGNISWVITGDLNDGLLKETSKKITEEAIKDYNMLKMYPKNSLIIAMYGATIGKIALLNIEACTNQACCVLAKSKIFETKYVFYWFIANKNNIISYSYGGGQPNISQDVIKTLKIPIPPKLEQKAIVEHLDKATRKIDKTIQRIEQKIKLLEEYKKSLIHHVVTGKMDVRGSEI